MRDAHVCGEEERGRTTTHLDNQFDKQLLVLPLVLAEILDALARRFKQVGQELLTRAQNLEPRRVERCRLGAARGEAGRQGGGGTSEVSKCLPNSTEPASRQGTTTHIFWPVSACLRFLSYRASMFWLSCRTIFA
jgi:hypothetical protein